MADFTDNLALVNGIAERSAGFVRRDVDQSGNATYVDPRTSSILGLGEPGSGDHAFDWQAASAQLWKTARCAPAGRVA